MRLLLASIVLVMAKIVYAQVSQVPVYRSPADSIALITINSALSELGPNVEKAYVDSLIMARTHIYQTGIIGYKTVYLPNKVYTPITEVGITIQPADVFRLSISGSQWKTLPKEILASKKLIELELVNTRITRIPGWIRRLENLKTITIKENLIDKQLRFASNKTIKTLLLEGNSSSWFPRHYGKLRRLELITVKAPDQSRFPDIYRNKHIRELNADNGMLTLEDLKTNKQVKSLNKLSLIRNSITYVPDGIAAFPNLQQLKFNFNRISGVSPRISSLSSLHELSFYRNALTEIPKPLYALDQLREIDLYYNKIERVDPEITQLKNLEILYLSYNAIYSLPDNLGELTSLQELYLSENKLSFLPPTLDQLKNLRILRVNDNRLHDFPEDLLSLSEIQTIDIATNEIMKIPPEIKNFARLKLFVFNRNPLIEMRANELIDLVRTMKQNGVVVDHEIAPDL